MSPISSVFFQIIIEYMQNMIFHFNMKSYVVHGFKKGAIF